MKTLINLTGFSLLAAFLCAGIYASSHWLRFMDGLDKQQSYEPRIRDYFFGGRRYISAFFGSSKNLSQECRFHRKQYWRGMAGGIFVLFVGGGFVLLFRVMIGPISN
ncbi:MAG: hypothetical protein KGL11_03625 [Alphaproteobacteria bacterium]|nr:hypothetical protein [Alphaproteobacteria bacterium]